jgi:ATP-dependent dihydroxyacetone kinase
MPHFINARDAIVTEAIDGFLWASGDKNLVRLDGYPGTKVVFNRNHNNSKVAVISGGGSGHEPAHLGFVGKGILAAAVCGEIFASPSVDAVLAAILTVTGEGGCLLVVKNYTGDRLNFGLAAERARALGKRVEMVIVADDIAIEGLSQPRGVAGTVFVHKVAGYFAEKGLSLAKVKAKARAAATSVKTIGLSLSSCNVPGSPLGQRIAAGKIEVGLGIHGEPGARLLNYADARQVADLVISQLLEKSLAKKKFALLLNNLGSTTSLEMSLLANALMVGKLGGRVTHIVGPAPLVTSLDMHGFSVSLMPLTPDFRVALEASVAAPAWPGARRVVKPRNVALPALMKEKAISPSFNATSDRLLIAACDTLAAHEDRLNELDGKIGDGDTGTTIATAALALKKARGELPLDRFDKLFSAVSTRLLAAMGGSSGVLLAILFASAGSSAASGKYWAVALLDGLERVKQYGGARLGDRTMIDALEPALQAIASGKTLRHAAGLAREGADATATMTRALAGRASYVPSESLGGVKDPGAEAVAILFEALARGNEEGLSSYG